MHPFQLWEPACWRWRPSIQPISPHAPIPTVGAGLLAMASEHPTNLSTCTHSNCGSRLAGDGVRASNQSLHMHPFQLWEPACWRWRPSIQPISPHAPIPTVGAGLLAMASEHPTNLSTCTHSNCGSRLAGDGVRASNQSLHMHPFQLWEPACWRWRPDNQPIPPGYTPSTLQLITETNAVPRLAIERVQRFIRHGFGRFQCNVVVPGIAKSQSHRRR
ncbi:hypothetical protein D3C87_1324060 [compost metagenome]